MLVSGPLVQAEQCPVEILLVDSRFDELPEILPKLPDDGLFLVIQDRFIPDEPAFQEFVASYW